MNMRRIALAALTSCIIAVPAFAQSEQMIATGCLMKEMDYRRVHKVEKGALWGLGLGDEFVLVENGCNEVGKGMAYRLTGKREDELKPLVGKRIEVTGSWDKPHDAKAAAGLRATTLPPEFKIASFREAPAPVSPAPVRAAAAPAVAAPAAPAAAAPIEAQAPASVVARNETPEQPLPNTASNLPLVGLLGLVSLVSGLGLHFGRPRAS